MRTQEPKKNYGEQFWSPAGSALSPVSGIGLVGEQAGLPEQSALVLVSSHTSGLNELKTHTHTRDT